MLKRKVRLIFTTCTQDGPEHWSQAYKTIDTEVELPDKILGCDSKGIGFGKEWVEFVGLEFLEVE